jgi:hypothetical protein
MDGTENLHAPATAIAYQNVHQKNTFDELGPGVIPGPASALPFTIAGLGGRIVFCRTSGMRQEILLFSFRNHQRPPGGRRSQDSVIANLVKPRRRHKRSKFAYEFQRLKDDVRCPVAPAALEAIEQPAVAKQRQPLRGHRRAASIAKQPFQPKAIASF